MMDDICSDILGPMIFRIAPLVKAKKLRLALARDRLEVSVREIYLADGILVEECQLHSFLYFRICPNAGPRDLKNAPNDRI